jgi:lambda repressor-like predicted transcriptional regulator
MAGKRGRPKGSVKLTPARTDIIVQALEKGHSLTSAARMAGLHRDTLQRWMKRGRKGENGVFSHFYVTVQEALAILTSAWHRYRHLYRRHHCRCP